VVLTALEAALKDDLSTVLSALDLSDSDQLKPSPLALVPDPARTSRSARAPKLIRLANGVVGLLSGDSASSIAFSSIPVEPDVELDMLSRLVRPAEKGEVCGGEDPERPRVVNDIRRLC